MIYGVPFAFALSFLAARNLTRRNRLSRLAYTLVRAGKNFTIYRWDINVRMSTIIGFVGGGGIGYILKPRVDLRQWGEVGTLVLLIALTVWVMDILSAKIRERIV